MRGTPTVADRLESDGSTVTRERPNLASDPPYLWSVGVGAVVFGVVRGLTDSWIWATFAGTAWIVATIVIDRVRLDRWTRASARASDKAPDGTDQHR